MSPPSTPSRTKTASTTDSPAESTSTASTTPCSDPTAVPSVHELVSPAESTTTASTTRCREPTVVPSVRQLAKALVEAAKLYKERDAQARLRNEHFDEYVQVGSGNFLIDIELLGQACEIAKSRSGRLRVDAFRAPGEEFYKVFVREVASGNTHGRAVMAVAGRVENAVLPFSSLAPRYAGVAGDSLYGTAHISAPDVTVESLGTDQGQPTAGSELGPLFFLEVENGNRSLLDLIRHLGMLLANFPRLNGVFGIKGEEKNGNRILVLILIEWRTNAATGVRQPCLTELIDFGPDSLSNIRRGNAETALQLPLPPAATRAIAGTHGAGVVAAPFSAWTRLVRGMDAAQQRVTVTLPATLLLAGARDTDGAIVNIPGNALGAEINLEYICSIYFP
jgi:hypothetical protein